MKNKIKVFVFEDETITRNFLADSLRNEGYEVTACGTYNKALRLLDSEGFDLALLDIKQDVGPVPKEIDRERVGFLLAERINAQNPIPILFITGYSDLYKEAKEFGPYVFLEKDDDSIYDIEQLCRHIDLAIKNFQESSLYRPNFSGLPGGMICINHGLPTGFIRELIRIEDILCFSTENGSLKIYTSEWEVPFVLKMGLGLFYQQLFSVIEEQGLENPFSAVHRSSYANLDKIVAFRGTNPMTGQEARVFYDRAHKISVRINRATYQLLDGRWPCFSTRG